MTALPCPVLVVLDAGIDGAPLAGASRALEGGAGWLLARAWALGTAQRRECAVGLQSLAVRYGAVAAAHDDPLLAAELGMGGLHLSQRAFADGLRPAQAWHGCWGVSAHSPAELHAAWRAGAWYATLSPVFDPTSKVPERPALGLACFREWVCACPMPVYALGGITPSLVRPCLAAGAAGVAVIGAVLGAPDPRQAMEALLAGGFNARSCSRQTL